MTVSIPFSDQSPEAHSKRLVTPLGAAIVEALPDREKVKELRDGSNRESVHLH